MAVREPSEKRIRDWSLVRNNYTDKDFEHLWKHRWARRYVIIGFEEGDKKQTPHLQCYVYWKAGKSFSSMKKEFPSWHIEPAMKDAATNRKYCSKSGNFKEDGEPPQQGKRTDLEQIADAMDDGMDMFSVSRHWPSQFIRYHKGLDRYRSVAWEDRTEPPEVYWFYGNSGTGKTLSATKCGYPFYIKDGTHWWDGYEQQRCIIIDDFDGKWPFRDFLRLLDRYPYQGQYKGGYIKINSPKIVITCEFPPDHFWQQNTLAQVTRRLTKIVHFLSDGTRTEVSGNTMSDTSPSSADHTELELKME